MIQPTCWLGVSSQFFWPFDQIVLPEVSGRVLKTSTDVEPTLAKREPRLAGWNRRPQSRNAVQVDGPSEEFGGPPHRSSGRKNVLPPEALPPCFRPEARAPQKQPSVASMIGGCETKRIDQFGAKTSATPVLGQSQRLLNHRPVVVQHALAVQHNQFRMTDIRPVGLALQSRHNINFGYAAS